MNQIVVVFRRPGDQFAVLAELRSAGVAARSSGRQLIWQSDQVEAELDHALAATNVPHTQRHLMTRVWDIGK